MAEDMWGQIGFIVDNAELRGQYEDALERDDWRQAHFLLLYFMLLHFEKGLKDMERVEGVSEKIEKHKAGLEHTKRWLIPILEDMGIMGGDQ